jgi:CSLREA domain-containing protein
VIALMKRISAIICRSIIPLLLAYSGSVQAASFSVDSQLDAVDAAPGDGQCLTAASTCTLRAAIQEANALGGAHDITLPAGIYDLTIAGALEDFAVTGDLDIRTEIVINGDGADVVFIDGMALDRVFHIINDTSTGDFGKATLNGVTIRNGDVSVNNRGGFGGGIYSEASLVLNDCNIDRNLAAAGGGGIYASYAGFSGNGTLEINRCVISNNFDYASGAGMAVSNTSLVISDSVIRNNQSTPNSNALLGGGLYYSDTNYATPLSSEIRNTTISDNSSENQGGGIHVFAGKLDIINSTISGNQANVAGGGVYVGGSAEVTLTNVTITNNTAPVSSGGGLYLADSTALATFTDSIIAANPSGSNCVMNGATVTRAGSNLDSDTSCGVSLSGVDPLLGSLADNGGPGYSHALLAGSPALDAAGACLATDQRSYTRPGSGCDLGAYEAEGVAPVSPVVTPLANTGTSTDADNNAPTAFDMPYAVTAGGVLTGIMNASDLDGDALLYFFPDSGPSYGSVGSPEPGSADDIPGAFVYTPAADAPVSDSFTYHVCDSRGACSASATISISITAATVAPEINVELTPDAGTVNDLTIISEASLYAIAPDIDYTYPIGGYFFSVSDVPTDSGGTAGQTVITIQLPVGADIPADAVVRKMDNQGVWQTLGSAPDPTVSTAVIDTVAKTITLTLRDNDVFDTNPTIGVINDPVALGVSTASAGDGGSGSVTPPVTDVGSDTTVGSNTFLSGGGGALLYLPFLLIPLLVSRRCA